MNDALETSLPGRFRAAITPFAWLAVALVAASVLAFGISFLFPSSSETRAWNPLLSTVAVEFPGVGEDGAAALAASAREEFPGFAVELEWSYGVPWISVTGDLDTSALAARVQGFARDQGLATGAFTMSSNLARITDRLLEDPSELPRAVASLLPLTLFGGSAVLFLFGLVLRRRLPESERARTPVRSLAFRLVGGVVLGLLLIGIGEGISALAEALGAPVVEQAWVSDSLAPDAPFRWVVVALVALVAPLGEEMFFRGYLLPALVRPVSEVGAIVLSSIAFGLVHGNTPALPAYLAYGVGLAIAARRTRSLVTPSAAHVTINSFAVAMLLF